jgi:hypothetical protein
MKSMPRVMLHAFVFVMVLTGLAYSQVPIGNLVPSIKKAVSSHDTNGVASSIRDVEKLWEQTPDEYLRVTSQAIRAIWANPDNDMAQKTLTVLFTNVFAKTCPGDSKSQAIMYFDAKREISLSCLGADAIRGDKASLLALASFIGEIRSHRIPDYANKGTSRPGLDILAAAGVNDARLLSNPVHIQAYAEAVKANEELLLMNNLQSSLLRADKILTFHLIHLCSNFSGDSSENTKFHDSIIKNAHLTDAEARKLTPKK